ncbi:MAG: nucleotidyltransferase domain-containing protein [Firmicutes bacterium]|nr:nucleotidyltransferase domain-containing protein [Bacillota bacterium]
MRLDKHPKKLSLDPEQTQQMIEFIQSQEDIIALILYGSYGTRYQTELSDIDLAVLPHCHQWPSSRLLDVMATLVGIGKTNDINVINLRQVPITLQMRVLDTGEKLFVRDPIALADFTEQTIRGYCDFAPFLKAFYRDYDIGLRKEFC